MRADRLLIGFAYLVAGLMALHVALLGLNMSERFAVWTVGQIVAWRQLGGLETPP